MSKLGRIIHWNVRQFGVNAFQHWPKRRDAGHSQAPSGVQIRSVLITTGHFPRLALSQVTDRKHKELSRVGLWCASFPR
jgi:hypothetical protein